MSDEPASPLHPTVEGGSRPVPDPTVLTTEALTRQISNLKELLESRIEAAIEVNKVKFHTIDDQFAAIEAWRKEQKLDTQTAVNAALLAAKEAVREQTAASDKSIAKSESSAIEQSKQQSATFAEKTKSLESKVDDLKERVLRMESSQSGALAMKAETRTQRNDSQALVFALIGIGLTVAVAGISIALALATR